VPELPEVQTVVSDLNRKIVGYTVVDFWSDWPKAIKNKTLKNFQKEIKNRKVLQIRRIGKNIFIDLSGGKTLYLHLKMTGHLLLKPTTHNPQPATHNYFKDKVNQYIHHIWTLRTTNREPRIITLEFSDVRKFAKIVLADTNKINELPEIKKLGVDAMSPKFTWRKFKEILAKSAAGRSHTYRQAGASGGKKIGIILMDQELIAGIGNIYRSEILFDAKIHPEREIARLSESEKVQLQKSIKKILKQAIKMRGTSDSDYRDTAGAPGGFQKVLKVYRRSGEKCSKCGIMIARKMLGQRSVFFCPKCQR
jgi:formamidopyrimidine-DNA glycosylase